MSGLLHPKERVVQVTCNGIKTDLKMKLDEQGEAFFVYETSVRPQDLDMTTSPIVSPMTSPVRVTPKRNNKDDDTISSKQTDVLPPLDLDSDGGEKSPASSETSSSGGLSPTPLVQFTSQQPNVQCNKQPIKTIQLSDPPVPTTAMAAVRKGPPRCILKQQRQSKFPWRWRKVEEDSQLETKGKYLYITIYFYFLLLY